jgi:hypothetical protein
MNVWPDDEIPPQAYRKQPNMKFLIKLLASKTK